MLKTNEVMLNAKILDEFSFKYEYMGIRFYTTKVAAKRKSEKEDIIDIIIPETHMIAGPLKDTYVCIDGEFSSFNEIGEDQKSHLRLYVFVNNIQYNAENSNLNEVYLRGRLCKPVVLKRTPLGKEIADFMIAVRRNKYRSDFIPCIAWGGTARFISELKVGDKVNVWGRIQSRNYIKKNGDSKELKVAYELSTTLIEKI